ncbi:MAG: hypothetical protein U1E73_12905 [Planctomycetota bacterium]
MRSCPIILSLLTTAAVAQTPSMLSQTLTPSQLAFDSARQRILATSTSGIWEHDGVLWAPMAAAVPEAGSLVYDTVQGRSFLVGSLVHEYDGHSFTLRPGTRPAPPTRLVVDMQRSVLVALDNGATVAIDEWNGTQWSTVAALPSAGFRSLLGAAYDFARGVTVFSDLVIGGFPAIQVETWEWNGTSLAGPFTVASSAINTLMAFDPGLGQVVAFRATGVFAWSGTAWVQVSAAPPPAGIGKLSTDLVGARVLGIGTGLGSTDGVWQWIGGAWSLVCSLPQPEMFNALSAYDEGRGRLFAMAREAGPQVVIAEWDGRIWSRLPLPGTAARDRAERPVYDAARGEVVLFGGRDIAFGYTGDTWAWNGASWRLAATTGPSPRTGAAMAYDPLRARVVLVGGTGASGLLSDHWEWDGVTWTSRFPSTPMAGDSGVIGVDPVRNRVVYAGTLGGAYEFDGTTWSFITNTGAAPQSGLVWDPSLQHLVGTMTINGSTGRYEWTGTAWQPVAGSVGELAYDTSRGRMFVLNDISLVVDTPTPAARADIGSGCSSTGVVTTLTAFGMPRVGNAGFHLDLSAAAPGQLHALALGFGVTTIPLGQGCALYFQNQFAAIVGFTANSGFTPIGLPIPNALAMRGVQFVAQAGVLDPAAPLGFVTSQGLLLTLGD